MFLCYSHNMTLVTSSALQRRQRFEGNLGLSAFKFMSNVKDGKT